MNQSKVLSIFKVLTKEELNLFERFVTSPIYNRNDNVVKLFKLIKENYPDYTSEKLSKKFMFTFLYPGEQYNDQKMRHLTSELLTLGEEFLAYLNYKTDPFFDKRYLLNELILRKLDKLFEKNLKETQKQFEKVTVRDEDYYYYKFLVEAERHSFYYLKNKYGYDKDFQNVTDNLLYSFLINILSRYGAMLPDIQRFNTEFKLPFLNEVLDYLKDNPHKDIIYLLVSYKEINLLLNEDDESNYYELIDLLEINHDKIYKNNLRGFYIHLLNYCNKKIRSGNYKFVKEKFILIKKSLPFELYFRDGYFLEVLFNSFIDTALNLKEFDWVEKFIEEYKEKLKPEDKTTICNFNYAKLKYSKGCFEEALSLFSTVEGRNYVQKFDIKKITMKIHYELNNLEPLLFLIDSTKHFIRNYSINEDYKTDSLNFMKCIERLAKIRWENKGIDYIKILEKDIVSLKNYSDHGWFLEKLKNL